MSSYWVEKYKTEDGPRWHVRFRDDAGKKHTVPKSKTKLRSLAYDIRNTMEEKSGREAHDLADPEITVVGLVKRYVEYRESLKRRPRTIQAIKYATSKLTDKFGDKRAMELTNPGMTRWKDELLTHHSINGFKDIWRVVEAVFRYALKRSYLRNNPAEGVDDLESVKVHRFLNDREVNIVLQAFAKHEGMTRIVKTALYEFMRKSEILLLRPDQVLRDSVYRDGRLVARARIFMDKEQIKTKKDKSVPVHPECEVFLLESDPGRWFNRGWSVNRVNRAWARGIGRANKAFPGFGKCRFHDLKHTACSNFLKNGGTLAELSEMTGNDVESLATTYAHFESKHLHEKIGLVSYPVPDQERPEIVGQIVGQVGQKTGNKWKQSEMGEGRPDPAFTVDKPPLRRLRARSSVG